MQAGQYAVDNLLKIRKKVEAEWKIVMHSIVDNEIVIGKLKNRNSINRSTKGIN